MALPSEIKQREWAKFIQSPTRTDGSAVEIAGSITAETSPGPFSAPAGTDCVVRSVLSNVETYQYKQGGLSGSVLKTVTVTYVASDLKEFVSAVIS